MKKTALFILLLGMVSLMQAAATDTVLFSDNYNRGDAADIDSSSTGTSGTLVPMVYQEAFEGSGQPTSIQILSNELNIAVGAGMSSLYLDHNFTDAAILNADGFSIAMDVVAITSADDTGNRFGGFGVGNTLTEAQAAGDSFDSDGPFRPALFRADQGIGVSDFYVDLALDQNLRIWSNGSLLNTINVGTASGTIKVDFFVTDFNAGTPVLAVVYFNDVQQDIRTFTWDNTDLNYIGISGRTAGAGVFLDNLSIASIYEDRAHQPSPAEGAMLVNASGLELSWNKGKDGAGNPNAQIAQHYLYIAENEPNFMNVSPITVPDTADPVTSSAYAFSNDTLYYWRVDESILVGGITPSDPTDPNTIPGYIWSFDTYTFPVIDTDPDQSVAAPSESAQLTCDFSSVTAPSVTWFEVGDPDAELMEGGDITIDLMDNNDGSYTSTLTIANLEIADEGRYYCLVENAGGSGNAVASEPGSIGVKRIVAHWTLDNDINGYADGRFVDISGEGHDADPNVAPTAASFVPGVDPTETGDALDFEVDPLVAADSNSWAPSLYTGAATVSAWLNWAGSDGGWQGVISNRSQVGAESANFYIEIRQDNGNLQVGGVQGMGDLQIDPLPIGEWVHLVMTAQAGEVVIYINGMPMNSSTDAQTLYRNIVPVRIGALNRSDEGVLLSTYNGKMDDVRIYNYALDQKQVADLYYDVLEIPVCVNPENLDLTFDVAGGGQDGLEPDCRVNLADFAQFAQTWLGCGLYPQTECP